MFYSSNWIHSFPQQYQWSNATLVTKGMAPYGAVALGEIDWVVQRLHERIDEPHAWWEEWSAVAAQVEHSGDEAAAEGRHATAGNCYLRAGMTRALAKELGEHGIRVNCVSPGHIGTTRPAHRSVRPAAKGLIPLGRWGETEEIAATVRFLCGPGGGFITGQTIHVNGGQMMFA